MTIQESLRQGEGDSTIIELFRSKAMEVVDYFYAPDDGVEALSGTFCPFAEMVNKVVDMFLRLMRSRTPNSDLEQMKKASVPGSSFVSKWKEFFALWGSVWVLSNLAHIPTRTCRKLESLMFFRSAHLNGQAYLEFARRILSEIGEIGAMIDHDGWQVVFANGSVSFNKCKDINVYQ